MEEKQQLQSNDTCLSVNKPQSVYLIADSHLDRGKFPTRESFGRACAMEFRGNKALYIVCDEEARKLKCGALPYCYAVKFGEDGKLQSISYIKNTVLLVLLSLHQMAACVLGA